MDYLQDLESSDISRISFGKSLNAINEDYEDSALPKINFITFNGDETKWENFRNISKSLLHNVVKVPLVNII